MSENPIKNIIILEDNHDRIAWFVKSYGNSSNLTICTTVEAFKSSYMASHFDAVFLDHDLGGQVFVPSEEGNTGYQAALFIVESMSIRRPGLILIHSHNNVGTQNMLKTLEPIKSADTEVVASPFGMFKAGGWD